MTVEIKASEVVIAIELKSDGTVWLGARGQSMQVGTVSGDQVVSTDPSRESFGLAAAKDNTVVSSYGGRPTPMKMRFDDKDVLVLDKVSMSVDDKGEIIGTSEDGSKEKMATVTGLQPGARRTALLLLMFYMAGRKAEHRTP